MKHIISILLILLFVVSVSASDYYVEKTISTGDSISINNQSYNIVVGNSGQRLRISQSNISYTYLSLDRCRYFNNTELCFLDNISDFKSKISIRIDHGRLWYDSEHSIPNTPTILYKYQPVEITEYFANTGNLTIEVNYTLNGQDYFYMSDCEDCKIMNNTVQYKSRLKKGETSKISYYMTPIKTFLGLEFNPVIYYHDGISVQRYNPFYVKWVGTNRFKQIDYSRTKSNIYSSYESVKLEMNQSRKELDQYQNSTITVRLNNTLKEDLYYSIDFSIDDNETGLIDFSRLVKRTDYYNEKQTWSTSGTLKYNKEKSVSLKLKYLNSGKIEVPITIYLHNDKLDFRRTINLSMQVRPVTIEVQPEPIIEEPEKDYTITEHNFTYVPEVKTEIDNKTNTLQNSSVQEPAENIPEQSQDINTPIINNTNSSTIDVTVEGNKASWQFIALIIFLTIIGIVLLVRILW